LAISFKNHGNNSQVRGESEEGRREAKAEKKEEEGMRM
jgi:hypothetical protein